MKLLEKRKEKKLNKELENVNQQIAELKKGLNQIPFQSAANQKINQGEETQEPTQFPEPIQKEINKARIIGCEILENNLFKFTIISNAIIGDVGQEFDI